MQKNDEKDYKKGGKEEAKRIAIKKIKEKTRPKKNLQRRRQRAESIAIKN